MDASHLNDNFNRISEKRFVYSVTVTLLLAYFQIAFINAYVVIYLETDLITSIFIITAIVSMRNVLQLLFRVPLGELSQKIGRKPLMVFGNLCFSLALLLSFLADDWIFILFAIILLGFGMSSFWPACFSYLGDISDERYGENNGKMFQGMDIGLIASSLLAVLLLDYLNIELKDIFGIFFILGIIFLLIVIKILPETLRIDKKLNFIEIVSFLIRSFTNMIPKITRMTKKPILRRVYLLQLVISFTEFMITAFFPVLIFNKGFSKGTIGFIILVGTVILIGFKPLLGKLTDKFGFERPIIIFLTLSCLTIISMTFTNDLYILIFLYALVSGSLLTSYTAVNGAASKFSSNAEKGLALGVLGFWVSFGRATSTLLIGPLWEQFSIAVSLATYSLLILTFLFLYWILVYKKNPIKNNEVKS